MDYSANGTAAEPNGIHHNHANGFYSDLIEDSHGAGLVYSTPAVASFPLKPGIQKVSEGTQTPQRTPSPSVPTWPSGTPARFQTGYLPPPAIQGHSTSPSNNGTHGNAASLHIPMTPPRISSLTPKNHSADSSPAWPSSHLQQHHLQHLQQQAPHNSRYNHSNGSIHANGNNSIPNGVDSQKQYHHQQHQHPQNAFALEPSPTLSTTESFSAGSIKSMSASSPASSISVPVGNTAQPTPVDLALAALSASPPRTSTSTTSSTSSTPTNRPRPSSYSPTKVANVASTLANMTTLATLPIPSSSTSPVTSTSPSVFVSATVEATLLTKEYKNEINVQDSESLQPQQEQQLQQPTASTPTEQSSQLLPASTTRPKMSIVAAGATVGAGGGYHASPKASPTSFAPPARASTMDYRKLHSNSLLLGDSPLSSTSKQQQQQQQQFDQQGENSTRSRRKQVFRRNTYSADLATTSFHRSDDEMEMDELEARRRMDALKKSSSRRLSKRKKDDDNDRVMIGTRIGEDHVNYVLMYNMLTGIRVSVSRCQAKPQRALVDEDFTSAHKLAFDITGNELTPSSKYDFKFKDYAPWVFRHLREDFHIDASDYLVSLTSKYILSELGSPGKSGSFFYFSQDYRFIIKTIHHAEHKFMRKILKDYFNHVKQNPHTLLCRFFGLHRVKLPHGRKIHFVVMGNVFPPNRDIHETYDLKGSTLGRAISDEELNSNPRATQKDLNWVNRNRKLELGPEKRHLFVEQTKRDVELLARLNIMDYSLLIGIHDIERGNKDNIRDNTLKVFHPDTSKQLVREPSRRDKRESKVNALRKAVKVSDPVALGPSTLPSDSFSERRHCIFYADDGGLLSTNEQNERGEDLYYLGIIDILTPYNYVKKIEHYWKSLSQDKHAISSVNPREYASRFLSFMIHAIKVNHDVLPVLERNSHPHSE
ncbi:Phosphatidylinositol-4-phosphate 5-kinase [Haplosporangium sp. Z 11]|nr:Phosphatidylinositol-4-phosphate 5-kinase [Haplosporangium sp. Z 11]